MLIASTAFATSDFDETMAAAKQGSVIAQYNLGIMYENGKGVKENDAEAAKWFRKAAEQGDEHAQYNLGFMYSQGRGLPENDAEAVKWYRKAANQGDAKAQANLAVMHFNGDGVPENNVRAYIWWSMAKTQGLANAANAVDAKSIESSSIYLTRYPSYWSLSYYIDRLHICNSE